MLAGVCCAYTGWIEKETAKECVTLDLRCPLHYFINICLTFILMGVSEMLILCHVLDNHHKTKLSNILELDCTL